MNRWVEVRRPAYDCIAVQPCKFGSDSCRPGSGGSHGRHSVELCWYVSDTLPTGETAVVQFLVYTGWMLDATPQRAWGNPMAADIGFHWPFPQYRGQEPMDNCHLLDGGHCYYDGSGLNAEEPWRLLREEGDEALWAHLEGYWATLAEEVSRA